MSFGFNSLGSVRTQDWEPMTFTLQAHSLVEEAEPVHGFLHGIKWIMFHGHLDYFPKPPLGGRPNTKPGHHGTPNAYNCCFILFYHVWGPAWIKNPWNNFWLRACSHMTSHYTWGSVTTIHDFGGGLGTAFGHLLWALTITWSWLLACVWSGPYCELSIDIQ